MSKSAENKPAGGAWRSTATLEEIAAKLRLCKSVVVTTHSKPDGDAVGSVLAMVRTLRRLKIEARGLFLGLWSPRFDAVVGDTPVVREQHGCWSQPPLSDIQDVLIVDTGSWNQLGDAKEWLKPRSARCIVVDHHAHGDADLSPTRFVETTAAAVCQPVAQLCCLLLGVKSPAELPTEVAEPLLLGIATDTGWFKHSNVNAAVLSTASQLVGAGARHNWLYQVVEQADEPSRLKLIGRALSSLEYLCDSKGAIMHVTKADLDQTGGSLDDAGGLTDFPQWVGKVRVAAVLVELEPNLTKLSLRSKASLNGDAGADVDVNVLAQTFGGGGHKHAAGAKIHAPMGEALERVRAALRSVLQ